jgi:hypothetical protein
MSRPAKRHRPESVSCEQQTIAAIVSKLRGGTLTDRRVGPIIPSGASPQGGNAPIFLTALHAQNAAEELQTAITDANICAALDDLDQNHRGAQRHLSSPLFKALRDLGRGRQEECAASWSHSGRSTPLSAASWVVRVVCRSHRDRSLAGGGWHKLLSVCMKANEEEIDHQQRSKRKVLDLRSFSTLKEIVKQSARRGGGCPAAQSIATSRVACVLGLVPGSADGSAGSGYCRLAS